MLNKMWPQTISARHLWSECLKWWWVYTKNQHLKWQNRLCQFSNVTLRCISVLGIQRGSWTQEWNRQQSITTILHTLALCCLSWWFKLLHKENVLMVCSVNDVILRLVSCLFVDISCYYVLLMLLLLARAKRLAEHVIIITFKFLPLCCHQCKS